MNLNPFKVLMYIIVAGYLLIASVAVLVLLFHMHDVHGWLT